MKFLEKHCSQCQAYKEQADTTYGMLDGDGEDGDGGHETDVMCKVKPATNVEGKQLLYKDKCC